MVVGRREGAFVHGCEHVRQTCAQHCLQVEVRNFATNPRPVAPWSDHFVNGLFRLQS